jgi:hypothetical protein
MLCDESQKGAAVAAIAETMVDSVGGGSIRMRRRALQALGQLSDANNEGEDGAGVMKEFEHSTAGNSNFEVHVPLEGDAIEEGALERIGVPPEKSTHVWDGLSRVPYSISGCFGPIGGVVYIRCNSRIWTYDINSMRVGHVQHEAYWDVWGGSVKHGNVRFSHLVPDMVGSPPKNNYHQTKKSKTRHLCISIAGERRLFLATKPKILNTKPQPQVNPAYSCSIGPIFRDGAWKVTSSPRIMHQGTHQNRALNLRENSQIPNPNTHASNQPSRTSFCTRRLSGLSPSIHSH